MKGLSLGLSVSGGVTGEEIRMKGSALLAAALLQFPCQRWHAWPCTESA